MSSEAYITSERLAWTADGRLVPYTDKDAAFLAYRPGDVVPLEVARKAGLVPADKMARPSEDKMVRPAEDKASLEVARPAEGEVALAVAQPAPRGRKRKNR